MRSIKLLYLLVLYCSCSYEKQGGYVIKPHYSIEELKWMLYSINFQCKPIKVYGDQKQENISFIQCSYKDKIGKYHFQNDTIVMVFSPYYKIKDSLYTSIDYPYCSQVYLKNDTFLFPSGDEASYSDFKNKIFLKKFLENQENQFINYLKNYNGKINIWLYNECKIRKITLNKDVIPEG